ncbi:BatD family protein [Prevotella sp. 10(H)]|uniref:BatD family protein n=1 Tax=Prevotella sp. 10(H) TaxID=1158294 RepID=UPI0004A776EA|nr:BatD family protein [Prevotella sp. 10(H)]
MKVYLYIIIALLGCIFITLFSCTPDRKRTRAVDKNESVKNARSADSLKTEPAITDQEKEEDEEPTISDADAFIDIVVSDSDLVKGQALDVEFRFYTKIEARNMSSIQWPESDDFEVQNTGLDSIRKMKEVMYSGHKYYTVILRKVRLTPQKVGELKIKPVTMEVSFSVPTGKTVKSQFGDTPVMREVKKTLKSREVTINVSEKK